MDDKIARAIRRTENESVNLLEKIISENKKLQGQINEINKENRELKSKIQSHEIQNRELKLEISQIEKSELEETLEEEEKKQIIEKKQKMADFIWHAYSDIAFKYGNTQHKYNRGFWGFIKKFFQSFGVNDIVLGLSILGSLFTFTSCFRTLIGITLEFTKLNDLIIIIMIKIPFAIAGFLAYRNIQRNRFFEEEYNHKKNIMIVYQTLIGNEYLEGRVTAIMLKAVESNPNDKLIKKDKDMTEKIIEVIENTVKTALQKEKNSNK